MNSSLGFRGPIFGQSFAAGYGAPFPYNVHDRAAALGVKTEVNPNNISQMMNAIPDHVACFSERAQTLTFQQESLPLLVGGSKDVAAEKMCHIRPVDRSEHLSSAKRCNSKLLFSWMPRSQIQTLDEQRRPVAIRAMCRLMGRWWGFDDKPYLVYYRRNILTVMGYLSSSEPVRYVKVNEAVLPVKSLVLSLESNALGCSEDGSKPAPLIYVPPTCQVSNAEKDGECAPPEDLSVPLDGENFSVKFVWPRIRFKSATGYNGRNGDLQSSNTLKVDLSAVLEDGSKVVISTATIGNIIVRGRSPSNFVAQMGKLLEDNATGFGMGDASDPDINRLPQYGMMASLVPNLLSPQTATSEPDRYPAFSPTSLSGSFPYGDGANTLQDSWGSFGNALAPISSNSSTGLGAHHSQTMVSTSSSGSWQSDLSLTIDAPNPLLPAEPPFGDVTNELFNLSLLDEKAMSVKSSHRSGARSTTSRAPSSQASVWSCGDWMGQQLTKEPESMANGNREPNYGLYSTEWNAVTVGLEPRSVSSTSLDPLSSFYLASAGSGPMSSARAGNPGSGLALASSLPAMLPGQDGCTATTSGGMYSSAPLASSAPPVTDVWGTAAGAMPAVSIPSTQSQGMAGCSELAIDPFHTYWPQ